MAISVIRFDLRAPAFSPASRRELFDAALEMAAFADARGFTLATLSAHHGVEDGYLPSPVVLAGVLAGATRRLGLNISALLVPLYDPVKLAEDLTVLDWASRGRLMIVAGLGYRPEEYAALGRDFRRRGKLLDECLEVMLRAWRGETFEYRGASVRVTPEPFTKPHPRLFVGGSTPALRKKNGLEQARKFTETSGVTGIVLTKLDGTAKGGVVIAIARELNLPIRYVGVGDKVDDLLPFDPEKYIQSLFEP